MLRKLLAWWAARISELVPGRLRARGVAPDAVVAELMQGRALRLLGRRRGRETPLGLLAHADASPGGNLAPAETAAAWRARLAGQPAATVLRLPPDGTMGPLVRAVTLPLAAERDLDRVLRFEMDRITPFAAADVVWTATVASRDRARDRLGIRLALVPRAVLRPALDALLAAGRTATALEVPDPRGPDRILRMALGAAGMLRPDATAGLAALCAVLAVAVVMVPFVRQSLALGSVERRIDVLRPAVAEAEALRRRMGAARASVDVVAAQRARVGDALAVLASITRILPDDTYLSELTLAQRKLGLRGQSGGAAQLIGLLSADPAIRDPAFSAPVVRNEAGHADLFSLRAEVAP